MRLWLHEKTMKKKLLAILLVVILIVCVSACGSTGGSNTPPSGSAAEAPAAQATDVGASTEAAEPVGSAPGAPEGEAAEATGEPILTEEETPAQTDDGASEEPEETEEPVQYKENTQDVYYVGDTFYDGNIDVTFVSLENTGSYNEFRAPYNGGPAEGQHYIKATFAFTNTADVPFGEKRERAYLRAFKSSVETYEEWASDDGEYLDPGKSVVGYVYLLVEDEDDDYFFYELRNVPTELKETIKLCATEEKDSGYSPEKNYASTPGAMVPGDTFEEPDLLKAEYLSCKPAEVSQWLLREGYRWVTIEIEFEDLDTNQEAHVAQFSIYDSNVVCYADGFRCNKQYQSDWMDFGDLEKGEKAVMPVTFEVPDDAQTVEVLIHSYYRSVEMVFDASAYSD